MFSSPESLAEPRMNGPPNISQRTVISLVCTLYNACISTAGIQFEVTVLVNEFLNSCIANA